MRTAILGGALLAACSGGGNGGGPDTTYTTPQPILITSDMIGSLTVDANDIYLIDDATYTTLLKMPKAPSAPATAIEDPLSSDRTVVFDGGLDHHNVGSYVLAPDGGLGWVAWDFDLQRTELEYLPVNAASVTQVDSPARSVPLIFGDAPSMFSENATGLVRIRDRDLLFGDQLYDPPTGTTHGPMALSGEAIYELAPSTSSNQTVTLARAAADAPPYGDTSMDAVFTPIATVTLPGHVTGTGKATVATTTDLFATFAGGQATDHVGRFPLDGSAPTYVAAKIDSRLVTDGAYVYWCDSGSTMLDAGSIYRLPAGFGDSDVPEAIATGRNSPCTSYGLAIDDTYLYWVERGAGPGDTSIGGNAYSIMKMIKP